MFKAHGVFSSSTCRSIVLSTRGIVRFVCTVQECQQSVQLYRNFSGKCCSPLLLQEVLSQNIGICRYFLHAPCKLPCFITNTENLRRGSASLLPDQCLLAQETKSKISVEISLKFFGTAAECSPQNCFRDIWNSSVDLSFVEGGISRAESAVVHQYSSVGKIQTVFSSKYPYSIFLDNTCVQILILAYTSLALVIVKTV